MRDEIILIYCTKGSFFFLSLVFSMFQCNPGLEEMCLSNLSKRLKMCFTDLKKRKKEEEEEGKI